jgi:sec-independent protein translocase protein TatC
VTATLPRGSSGDPDGNRPPGASPEPGGGEMTLYEHLNELRRRIFKSALAVALGFAAGFALNGPLFDLLIGPYCELPASLRAATNTFDPEACNLIYTNPLGGLFVTIKTAAVVAAVVGGPVFFYQVWRFVTPGLHPVERRYAVPFLVLSQLLFVGGAAFAYWIIPRGLAVLLSFGGDDLVALLDASEYIGFILKTLLGFGLAFEVPLIIAMLTLAGAVGVEGLVKYRRHAIFGAFVLAAIITPTQDPFTMLVMAVPLALFYELNILFARWVRRRRRKSAVA